MNHSPICYIAGALPLPPALPLLFHEEDYIIAADGGYPHLNKCGIVPHLVVGDFDSAPRPDHPNIISLPVEKDDTDMGYAIGQGISLGYHNFVLLGGLGGLLDHTMANLQHLYNLSLLGHSPLLIGDHQCATVLTNGTCTLAGTPGTRCSVFAFGGQVEGVTLQNLYYTVDSVPLFPNVPLGVSNSFLQSPATISVTSGSLLLIWDWSDSHPISTFFTHKEGE